MVAQYEAPTLYPEPFDAPTPPGRGKHGYYRNRRGWIVVASTTPSNRAGTEYKGGVFLARYGEFTNGTQGGAPKELDDRGVLFNSAHEQWRLIFQRGGAREFPVDQIVAYGWHLRPPYREVVFPQMEGTVVYDLPCPECDRVFSSLQERQVAQFLRIHLTSKIDEAHAYTPLDLKELGQEWKINFESARTRTREPRHVPSIEPSDTPALTPEMAIPRMAEFACDFVNDDGAACGWAPQTGNTRPEQSLAMHRRRHQRVAVSA